MMKMKFGKLLLVGATALLTFTASAQDDQKRECDRMRFLAGEEGLKKEDYKKAALYLHKAEAICGSLDKDNWERLLGSLKNVIHDEQDETTKKLYIDSTLAAYERQEAAGFYDPIEDLDRGLYYTQCTTPDVKKADFYFQRGVKAQGAKTHESYIVYAYYATYLLFNSAQGDEKAALKKRMIDDFFMYSEIVSQAGMTPLTQETLATYLDYAVESCEALLPEIPGYISKLPEDKDAAIEAISRMLSLLETKQCEDSDEHLSLVDAWLERDPNSTEALLKKLGHLPGAQGLSIINKLIDQTEDAEEKAGLIYQKAVIQLKAGQYKAAYTTGRSCTGKYRADGLYVAAKAVAATAMSCGDSTFERKCNYIYAAQLAEQAGQGGAAATYKSKAPSASECFSENSPKSVSLSCWGVTVNPCP